jgi:hypothetical protein
VGSNPHSYLQLFLNKLKGFNNEIKEVITLTRGPFLAPEVYFELRREEDFIDNSFLIVVLDKCVGKVIKQEGIYT